MKFTKHQAIEGILRNHDDLTFKDDIKSAIDIRVSRMAIATGHNQAEAETLALFIKHNAEWLREVLFQESPKSVLQNSAIGRPFNIDKTEIPAKASKLPLSKGHAATSINVGGCAITYSKALKERDEAQHALHVAYDLFKGVPQDVAGLGLLCGDEFYIERGTLEWDAMLAATAAQYELLKKAKVNHTGFGGG